MRNAIVTAVLSAAALCAGSRASTQEVRALLAKGNEAAARGDWDIAETMYRDASALDPHRAETLFNLARALQGMERVEEAENAYAEALRHASARSDIASRALFNLGDLAVRRADALEGENPQGAVDALRDASRRYREARGLDPFDADAGRNVEAVNRRIQALRDRMAQDKANREALEKLAQELEDLAQEQAENQSPSQDESQQGEGQGEQPEQGQEPGQQQSGQGQQGQQNQPGQPGAQQSEGRPDPLANRTMDAAKASEQLAQQMESAAESQGRQTSPAADALREASKRLQDAAQQREESRSADREGRPDEAASRREESARQTRDAERIVRELLEQARQEQQDQDSQQGEGESEEQQGAEGEQGQEGQEQAQGRQGQEQDSSAFDRQGPEQTSVDRLLDRERRVREALERARRPMTAPRPPVERDW